MSKLNFYLKYKCSFSLRVINAARPKKMVNELVL